MGLIYSARETWKLVAGRVYEGIRRAEQKSSLWTVDGGRKRKGERWKKKGKKKSGENLVTPTRVSFLDWPVVIKSLSTTRLEHSAAPELVFQVVT